MIKSRMPTGDDLTARGSSFMIREIAYRKSSNILLKDN